MAHLSRVIPANDTKETGFILEFETRGIFNAKLAFYLNFDIFSSFLSIQKYPHGIPLKMMGIFQKMGGIPLPRINPEDSVFRH